MLIVSRYSILCDADNAKPRPGHCTGNYMLNEGRSVRKISFIPDVSEVDLTGRVLCSAMLVKHMQRILR